MSPFGKIIIGLIGLQFWGLEGLLWGLFVGHIILDKSIANQFIAKKLNELDDNIRILLPFKFYLWYDKSTNLFDNKYLKAFKHWVDIFFDRNLAMIFFALIGFSLRSHILIFSGIIIGYFIDRFNFERSFKNKGRIRFWRRINPLKLALTSKEAKQVAFIQAMASLSAKVCMIDGNISENEVNTFKKLFTISEEQNARIANIFFEAQKSKEGYERHAFQIQALSKDDIELKESVIENLFKIATSDSSASEDKLFVLRDISDIIELPIGNFEVIKKSFQRNNKGNNIQDSYTILDIPSNAGDAEIKSRWKELITLYHPDKIQSAGGSAEQVKICSIKMAEINNAYQNIMKNRKLR